MAKLATWMVIFWVCVLICLVLLWSVVERSATMGKETEVAYSDLFTKVQNGQVLDATIRGNDLRGHLKASPREVFHTTIPANHDDLVKAMLTAGVNFSIKQPRNNALRPMLINLGVFALLFLAVLPPFWMIFKKAGFPPILSVLILVPVVNLITIYVVGFSPWKSIPGQKS
jgi:ATP-dependent Zn protease